ncbi:mRNA 3'-end-processing protein rna14, partial [Dispira parvispora]
MALRDRLETQVARKKYQPDVWSSLIRDALNDRHSSDQIRDERVRDVFNRLLEVYPLASAQWVRYATYEFERSHYDKVEEIFSRALSNVRAVDLYKFYMDYIYKMNTTETGLPTSPQAHNTILQASEFVLNRVGIDKDSGALWSQYLAYLKKQQPQSQWEEQQKIEGLRAAYHRAIVVPMDHLEQIWKEYDAFENGINRFT